MQRDDYMERYRMVEQAYADYLIHLTAVQEQTQTCGPHCDSFVLHAPGECEYCDRYPVLQVARQRLNIAYTMHTPVYGERPCPATLLRPVEKINRWGGNVPQGGEE